MSDLTFFSVDVETSGLVPGSKGAELLSIGAVAVSHDGWIVDTFYERIDVSLHSDWYLPPDDAYIQALPDDSTLKFWKGVESVDSYVAGEAYADTQLSRSSAYYVADQLEAWVLNFGQTWEDRIFVANPVSFDFAWTQDLLRRGAVSNPFHYRTLCLRSMAFGAADSAQWHDNHLREIL